jgi:hypothetical protein
MFLVRGPRAFPSATIQVVEIDLLSLSPMRQGAGHRTFKPGRRI